MNIKLDRDFRVYARIAYDLIKMDESCCITFSSCGKSIYNQLRIVSSLEEALPGLHLVTSFKLTECKTCLNKTKKLSLDMTEFRATNDQKLVDYVENI